MKKIQGTREWAVAEINCSVGCPNGCRYCYARFDSVVRKGSVSAEQWQSCRPGLEKPLIEQKYPGQVMFPAAHDIVPDNLDDCLATLSGLLRSGNKVLVVSKPNRQSVRRICSVLQDYRDLLHFRFTITARDAGILALWEPAAPSYDERFACLRYAYAQGFVTSVSIEPVLDMEDVEAMIAELTPYTCHSIWLGKMNKIEQRVEADSAELRDDIQRIQLQQNNENITALYERLKNNSLIRWKESIKDVVGLPRAVEPGRDE